MQRYLKTLLVLGAFAQAQSLYTVDIAVPAAKPDGKSWDMAGGAPDIAIKLNDASITSRQCRDTYRCRLAFQAKENDRLYIEVYDKDAVSDDLIAKGECTVRDDETCRLGKTVLRFHRKDLVVLADATAQVAVKSLQEIDGMLARIIDDLKHQKTVSEDTIYRLIGKIKIYRERFNRDLSPEAKKKLRELILKLRRNDGVKKELIDTVDRCYRSSQSLPA